MLARITLLFTLAIAGCGKPSTTNRVVRQLAAPTVSNDSRLAGFIGDWAGDEGVELHIARSADGSATISLPPNAVWDSIVNNVRLEGISLRYDLYMYYTGNEDLTTITNTVGDHPYSGVRNEVTLTQGDTPNTLKQTLVTKDVPDGVECVLRRHGGGG